MSKLALSLMILSTSVWGSIQQTCSLDKASVLQVDSLAELEETLCGLGDTSSDEQLAVLTRNTRDIINAIRVPGSQYSEDISLDPLMDRELLRSLKSISDLLNSRRAPTTFKPERTDDLSSSMSELFTKYSSADARKNDQQGYYQAMRGVLSKTVTGKKVLECFEKAEPRVQGFLLEFPKPGEDRSVTASFEPRLDEKTKMYDKVITFSPGEEPAQALITLTHEMQHACKTAENIALQDRLAMLEKEHDSLNPRNSTDQQQRDSADAIEAFREKISLRQTIDELGAYEVMPQIFAEIAPYHPDFFCQKHAIIALFGIQVMNTGQFASSVESGIKDGSLIHTLITQYSSNAAFDPAGLYQFDEESGDYRRGADGKPLFRPEVKAEIVAAGYRVP